MLVRVFVDVLIPVLLAVYLSPSAGAAAPGLSLRL